MHSLHYINFIEIIMRTMFYFITDPVYLGFLTTVIAELILVTQITMKYGRGYQLSGAMKMLVRHAQRRHRTSRYHLQRHH